MIFFLLQGPFDCFAQISQLTKLVLSDSWGQCCSLHCRGHGIVLYCGSRHFTESVMSDLGQGYCLKGPWDCFAQIKTVYWTSHVWWLGTVMLPPGSMGLICSLNCRSRQFTASTRQCRSRQFTASTRQFTDFILAEDSDLVSRACWTVLYKSTRKAWFYMEMIDRILQALCLSLGCISVR